MSRVGDDDVVSKEKMSIGERLSFWVHIWISNFKGTSSPKRQRQVGAKNRRMAFWVLIGLHDDRKSQVLFLQYEKSDVVTSDDDVDHRRKSRRSLTWSIRDDIVQLSQDTDSKEPLLYLYL